MGTLRYAVLAPPTDPSGPWAVAGLAARGLEGIRLVTPHELAFSRAIAHEVTSTGVATRITLWDDTVFGPDLVGTLNRTVRVPTDHLAGTEPADRQYAAAELTALFVSILAALPGHVVGRAGPLGLCGPWLRPADNAVAAARAGLLLAGERSGADPADRIRAAVRLIVVGDQALAAYPQTGVPVPEPVRQGCAELARVLDAQVLGVDLTGPGSSWAFVGATPCPDLRPGGPAVLDALAQELR